MSINSQMKWQLLYSQTAWSLYFLMQLILSWLNELVTLV